MKTIKEITDIMCWEGLNTVASINIPLLYNFFTEIEKTSKVYIMPSIFAERYYFSRSILSKFLLPEWDFSQSSYNYPKKQDHQDYFDKLEKQYILKEMKLYI